MSVIDWNGEARNILKAVRAVGYLDYILDGFEGLAQKYVAMAISKEGE